jgi:ADP-ribosylglycohydrolase
MTVPAPLLGCAIADALGKPFETKPWDHPAILNWDGRTYLPGDYPNLPKPYQDTGELLNRPGVPTDDTQMSRILARSMVDPSFDALRGYQEWLQGDSFVGIPRGMGGTIRRSLVSSIQRVKLLPCDPFGPCGTGAAMRAGVLGMAPLPLKEIVIRAESDSVLTHPGHPEAMATAAVMASAVCYYARRAEYPTDLTEFLLDNLAPRHSHTAMGWALRMVDKVYHLGAVLPTDFTDDAVGITASAVLIAGLSPSYASGVVRAIQFGGDTDTRAAMVGTILGTRFGVGGECGIPDYWLKDLYEVDAIMAEDQLLNTLTSTRDCRSEGSK